MTWNFLLYLLYGLAFFTLGVAILSRDMRFSELAIAKILWLLAAFGIIHGFHEWIDLLEQLNPAIQTPAFFLFRLLFVTCSFLLLFYFGLFLNIIAIYGEDAFKTTPHLAKLLVAGLVLMVTTLVVSFDIDNGSDINIRRFVAFPGGILAGIGLIAYSRTVRPFSTKVAGNFILAGICMIGYALFTGIIPSSFIVPVIDTKIILFRGISAFIVMVFTIRALSVFSLEQRTLINEQLQRFAQSEKLSSMGILAAGIAHEINNPLTNVSLNLEMLKDMVAEDEKINRKLDSIDRNVNRASVIAKELLNFSREKESDLEPMDINQVLISSKSLLNSQPNRPKINLHLNQTPEIMGIPWKLEEVFINLLMNSIDACRSEDIIDVETKADAVNVQVIITDTGHGISDEDLPQVFDPFYTTKDVGKGTGLGLSVCYNIIKQHGGEISIMSSKGGGTVVSINVPVMRNEN